MLVAELFTVIVLTLLIWDQMDYLAMPAISQGFFWDFYEQLTPVNMGA